MSHPSALKIIAEIFANILAPATPMLPSVWAAQHLIVPDGVKQGQKWDVKLTSYICEPLDMLAADCPVNEIAVRKSAQTGFTTLIMAAVGYKIDREPCNIMIIQPTDSALTDFNTQKLDPAIKQTAPLASKVAGQASRSGKGSTTYSKRFAGGFLTLAIATSAADLRSKSVKDLFRDEIDQYPDDLDGQGDPLELSNGRQMSFLSSGDWKRIDISTPTIKGESKIDARFLEGDQRYLFVKCPGCSSPVKFEWGDNFKFEKEYPYKAFYVAPCCGQIIESHQRTRLVCEAVELKKNGEPFGWQPTASRAGAFPSYHFDSLSSPFVPWDQIAKAFVECRDDPLKIKSFYNIWLGLPYEMKGDAPDHERLMLRRDESLKRYHIPPKGLLLVASADVQMRGLWVEVTAYAPDGQSWVVDADYLEGDTSDASAGAFLLLKERVLERDYADAFGGLRRVDALAIDSGYRSHIVYSFVRAHQRPNPLTGRDVILAIKGLDGWTRPAIGQPTLVDVDLNGKRIKQGARVWPIGTWSLKGAFYQHLNKEGLRAGNDCDPPGMCHFGLWMDENYFRQITAEYLVEDRVRGRSIKRWQIRPNQTDNHFLDARVYNMALAEYLGLSSTTPEQWANLARIRGIPEAAREQNLFTASAERDEPTSLKKETKHSHADRNDWLGGRDRNW
jgi:phage terminase large subunit GpA-like protein